MKSIRPDQIFTIKPLFDAVLSPPRKGYVRGNKARVCSVSIIIQAKAMHRIISLHMALFHVLFSYILLFHHFKTKGTYTDNIKSERCPRRPLAGPLLKCFKVLKQPY